MPPITLRRYSLSHATVLKRFQSYMPSTASSRVPVLHAPVHSVSSRVQSLYTRRKLHSAICAPYFSAAVCRISSISGSSQSSLSAKASHSPRAASMPALRALERPPFSLCSTRTRLSSRAYASQIAPHPSGLPSSTSRISRS